MSTIVYQGMQSCFESQSIETTILKLKVTDKKCDIQTPNKKPNNPSLEGFNFIQNTPSSPKEKQGTYIHPLTKTSPRLSQKSLELCTENLGSETGSDDGMDIDILSFNDVVEYSARDEIVSNEKQKKVTWKVESRISSKVQPRSFPPPLTSLRSSNSIQCRPHRENGRLIIEAIESPSRNTYLQAERSNGRLRLSFFNDCGMSFETEMNHEVDCEDDVIDDYDSDVFDEDRYEDGEEENGNNVKNEVKMEEEIIGNKIDIEGEIGIEKFQRHSRCMEGGHGNRDLCNWRNSLRVATS